MGIGGGGGGGNYGAGASTSADGITQATGTSGGNGGKGGSYGSVSIATLYLGSGGGAGGNGGNGLGGAGGRGGGAIYIGAATINIPGSGTIIADGNDGSTNTGSGNYLGGTGGGGGGGSLFIAADTATLGTTKVTAAGGAAGPQTNGNYNAQSGSAGGAGRIALSTNSVTGTTSPTYHANAAPARSLNDTSTLTTSSTDLSGVKYLTFWVRSPRTGSFAQFQFGESTSSEQTFPFTISSANTWEKKTWDISGITGSARDAVTKYAFKITDDSIDSTLYFDDLQSNTIPGIPTLDTPTNTAVNQSLTPQLKTTSTDVDSDYLRYKIIICTNSGMSVGCQTFDQTSSQTGWSGQNTQTSTAYTSGTQGVYTVQSALSYNTTYYWQSYAIDPGGSNSWSSTQSTPYSFSIPLSQPSIPNSLLVDDLNGPVTGIADPTPYFSAVHNDGNGFAGNAYQIQVNTSSDFTGTMMWDSGTVSMTNTVSGGRSPNITYAGSTLNISGTRYFWRIRFTDTASTVSSWSDVANFSTIENATSCVIQESTNDASLLINWINHASGNTGYEVRRSVNGGSFSVLHTGLSASATSDTDNTISRGNTYRYEIAPYYSGPTYGPFCLTPTLSIQAGSFKFSGLNFSGINLN
jgi:hypothetical protein